MKRTDRRSNKKLYISHWLTFSKSAFPIFRPHIISWFEWSWCTVWVVLYSVRAFYILWPRWTQHIVRSQKKVLLVHNTFDWNAFTPKACKYAISFCGPVVCSFVCFFLFWCDFYQMATSSRNEIQLMKIQTFVSFSAHDSQIEATLQVYNSIYLIT